jgi:hypothetical protein
VSNWLEPRDSGGCWLTVEAAERNHDIVNVIAPVYGKSAGWQPFEAQDKPALRGVFEEEL